MQNLRNKVFDLKLLSTVVQIKNMNCYDDPHGILRSKEAIQTVASSTLRITHNGQYCDIVIIVIVDT